MPTPYSQSGYIGGPLPPMPGPPPVGGTPASIEAAHDQIYSTAAAANTAFYGNIISGYNQVAAGQRTAQDALAGGYADLAGQIRDRTAASGEQERATAGWYGGTLGEMYGRQADIDQRYAGLGTDVQNALNPMGTAGERQQMVNAGLGNAYGGLAAGLTDTSRGYDMAGNVYAGQNTGLAGGYAGLQAGVMGTIGGVGRSELNDLNARYAAARGSANESAISRGLGNTTVRDSLLRGVEYDRARAGVDLADRMAQLRAGYQSSLGQAGLGFGERAAQGQLAQANLATGQRMGYQYQVGQNALNFRERALGAETGQSNAEAQARAGYAAQVGQQALGFRERAGAAQVNQANLQTGAFLGQRQGEAAAQNAYAAQIGMGGLAQQGRNIDQNTALAGRQLDWMNSVSAPYPNAGYYAQLAQMAAYNGRNAFNPLAQATPGGGMTVTRGGPFNPPGLGPSSAPPPGWGQSNLGFAPNGQPLNAGFGVVPQGGQFGNLDMAGYGGEPGGGPYQPAGGFSGSGGYLPASDYSESQGDAYGAGGSHYGDVEGGYGGMGGYQLQYPEIDAAAWGNYFQGGGAV